MWGSYVVFPKINLGIYVPRANESDIKEGLERLDKHKDLIFSYDYNERLIDLNNTKITDITLDQISSILCCYHNFCDFLQIDHLIQLLLIWTLKEIHNDIMVFVDENEIDKCGEDLNLL